MSRGLLSVIYFSLLGAFLVGIRLFVPLLFPNVLDNSRLSRPISALSCRDAQQQYPGNVWHLGIWFTEYEKIRQCELAGEIVSAYPESRKKVAADARTTERALKRLAADRDPQVRRAVAARPSLSQEVRDILDAQPKNEKIFPAAGPSRQTPEITVYALTPVTEVKSYPALSTQPGLCTNTDAVTWNWQMRTPEASNPPPRHRMFRLGRVRYRGNGVKICVRFPDDRIEQSEELPLPLPNGVDSLTLVVKRSSMKWIVPAPGINYPKELGSVSALRGLTLP